MRSTSRRSSSSNHTLAGLGAEPTAGCRRWSTTCARLAGCVAAGRVYLAQPTAWSAEGLLAFLPPDAQDRLLDNVTALSAPGSRLASENMSDTGMESRMRDGMHQAVDRWREHGFDIEMTDLWYLGDA